MTDVTPGKQIEELEPGTLQCMGTSDHTGQGRSGKDLGNEAVACGAN